MYDRATRKSLTRAYKAHRPPMGVYRVFNIANGKSLVGTSTDLRAILNRQRAQLRMDVHPNNLLQREWNTYGAESFAFEILDTLDRPDEAKTTGFDPMNDLQVLEALWLEKLTPFGDQGYHKAPR